MAEEISQEELTAVRQFIHVYRVAEKMERALTVVVTQQEQVGLLEGRYLAAKKQAEEAEIRAATVESEVAARMLSAEGRFEQRRKEHEAEFVRLKAQQTNDVGKLRQDTEMAKRDLDAQLVAAQNAHGAKLTAMRRAEAEIQERIDALEQGEQALREAIRLMESRKLELQDEFRALLK